MKCSNCNQEIPDSAKFCSHCGTPVPRVTLVSPRGSDSAPLMSNGQLFGVLGLVSGIIGIFIFPVIFGPAAIVLGILALNKRNNLGWSGIVLGGILVLIAGIALINALT